jgi:hypothetical protein
MDFVSDGARSAWLQRDLLCVRMVARILTPASKLATAGGLRERTERPVLRALYLGSTGWMRIRVRSQGLVAELASVN